MADLPSGTVTFLFTDIEGSTRLLRELRDRYQDVVADHHRLLRTAFEAAGGHEMGTEGDAFFVAFARARDAVAGALAAQRALAAHEWPEGVELRVRMGVHTGEPSVGDEGYVGLVVHRVARVTSAGHGGQILISNATREVIEDDLPPDVSLRDLGEHRFKDFERPQRIFQLVTDDLPSEFPPLKTLEAQPDEASPFAGREEELAAAAAAITARPVRRRALLLAALAGVLAAAVAIPVFALGRGGGGDGGPEIEGNALAVIDPETNRVDGEIPVGARPGDVVYGSGSIWVANLDDRTISRIDPTTLKVERTIPTGETPGSLAAGNDVVWFTSARPNSRFVAVQRVVPRFDSIEPVTRIRGTGLPTQSGGAIAAGARALWVVPEGLGPAARIDPATGRVLAEVDAANLPTSVALGAGAAWVADTVAGTVARIDDSNVVTATIPVRPGPSGIAVGAGAVWVASSLDDTVVRIDAATNAVRTTISVGRGPAGVAVGAGGVWIANSRDRTVSRIDPESDEVIETIRVGGSPTGIVVARGRVWVTVQKALLERSAGLAAPGGTARLNAESDVDSIDPALARDPLALQLEYATCAKLLNYPDRPAPAGSQVIPEVARTLPTLSADRRTYTFTVRRGFRFSPPSNEAVTAATFKFAIERALNPKGRRPLREFSELVGLQAFRAGRATHISGIVAKGNRLTVRLTEPVPDFTARIADPLFCALPTGTPADLGAVRSLASAGPYYIASYTPGQGAVLKRNPNYGGTRPRHLEEINLRVGIAKAKTVAEIEAGRADYAADEVPESEHVRLTARYGPGSPAARAGKQQYFVNRLPQLTWLELNENRPLFADVRARKAVNYAVDRRELAAQVGPAGEFRMEPTDQYLPPGMPGFTDVDVYPFRADVAAARRLLGGRRSAAVLYTLTLPPGPQLAAIVKANLAAIGIAVEIKTFPLGEYLRRLGTKGEPFDMAFVLQTAETPDPGIFLSLLFSGKRIYGTKTVVDAPAYGRRFEGAARLHGPKRYLAFGALDAELAREAAPFVALGTDTRHDFFSARMGCQIYNPVYGMSLAALCIRRSK